MREHLARMMDAAKLVTGWCWFEILRYAECDSTEIQNDIKKLEQAIAAAELSVNTGESKSLHSAAKNIIRKWRCKAVLTDADIEWLENSIKKEETK